MQRPTEQINWAINTLLDPVTGNINRAAPSIESTYSGLLRNEPLDRQLYNYHIWLLAQYAMYADTFIQINDVIQTTDNTVTTVTLANQLGGTWATIGSQVIGTDTIYYFKRVAN